MRSADELFKYICFYRGGEGQFPLKIQGTGIGDLELHRSPLNDPSLWRITVSQLSSDSVPGIARFRSALSAACWTETSPLSACFSKRSRSWCMTPSCTIRTQLPSEERGKTKQVREIRNTMMEINHADWEFRESLPWLFSCFDKIETVAFALFFTTFNSLEVSGHQPPVI